MFIYLYNYFSYYYILDDDTNIKFSILYSREKFYKSSNWMQMKSLKIFEEYGGLHVIYPKLVP